MADGYMYTVGNDDDELFGPVGECWEESWVEYIAESAADDYHREHDGWQSRWPIRFTIYKQDGTKLGVVDVDREMKAEFTGSEVLNEQ